MVDDQFFSAEVREKVASQLTTFVEAALDVKARSAVTNIAKWPGSVENLIEALPAAGMSLEELRATMSEKVLKYFINFSSPGYFGFPDTATSIAATGAALVVDIVPQNLINSRRWSPSASYVEITTVNWLRKLLGFHVDQDVTSAAGVAGFATTGGVLANTIAILVARENLSRGSGKLGVYHTKRIRTILPEFIDHYSIRTSVAWLGMGADSLVFVKTNGYRYDLDALRNALVEAREADCAAIVVAYAGDSRSLSVDRIEEIAELCQSFSAWLHVDACHGVQLSFSVTRKHLLRGIERADSVTVDPHKALWIPHTLNYVLFKNADSLKPVIGASDLVTTEEMSLGSLTPFIGTKRFDSLKLWALIKHLGAEKIGDLIDTRCALAKSFFDRLKDDPDFVLLSDDVDINGVIFMFIGDTLSRDNVMKINLINVSIHERLLVEGLSYLHTFSIPDLTMRFDPPSQMLHPLRFMTGNPHHTSEDVLSVIEQVRSIGRELIELETSI